LIGSAAAADVPFVFDEGSSSITGCTSAQLEQASSISSDLAGVPMLSAPSDGEVLEFPVTGGGNAPEGTTEKKVIDLKIEFDARVEPENPRVNDEAVVLALKYPGDLTVDQIASIYSYLKNGDGSKKGWGYVRDPRGIDYLRYANASLKLGDRANCVGGGDCDDFAILMSALVESIGGTTRIILARNNSTGGHAYTEVYLGQLGTKNSQVEDIINWLKQKFNTDKIYTHIDTDTKDVWLNLDWGADEKGNAHPGGPFYQGDKHIVLCIRDKYGKTPLKLPVKSNEPPKLISLTSDKPSPQQAGTAITWTVEAKDSENDPLVYRFLLRGIAVSGWSSDNRWFWATTSDDIGENQIEAQVRDTKHAEADAFDSSKVASFVIQDSTNNNQIVPSQLDQYSTSTSGGAPSPSAPPKSPEYLGLQTPSAAAYPPPSTQEKSQILMKSDEQSAYSAAPQGFMANATSPTNQQMIVPSGVNAPNSLYVSYAPQTVAGCNIYSNLPDWLNTAGSGSIWFYEWYPNGMLDTQYAGSVNYPGWYKRWFFADVPGWHILQYYCNGWSNYAYIYVYGPGG